MKLYNTMSRSVEEFNSQNEHVVSLYTCGLTVYSQPHIGNWVAYIYWDILERTLKANGYEVNRVQNITDVGHLTSDEDAGEDKMLKGAAKEGLTAWQVADKYIAIAEDEAYNQLGLLRPTHMPRATEYIPQQIAFVQALESREYTYKINDGIYFDTSKLSDYGKLARLDIDGLKFGARVEDTGKKNPTDFALWKFSPSDQKRDMEWDSPWGKGFPGWHLECSVMARELLGDTIDIHTGGIDHIPIHHTNEIAQSEALTRKTFANYWVHANHIKVDGTKMSKSLGNIYTLEDIIKHGYSVDAFKLMILSKHYRTEGNFTWEILEAAQNRLNNWLTAVDLLWQEDKATDSAIRGEEYADKIAAAMSNDLDTPKTLSIIDEAINEIINLHICKPCIENLAYDIKSFLGIDLLKGKTDIFTQQKNLIIDREKARNNKDWAESDRIRDDLSLQGLAVRDTPIGTIWSRLR
jgi:cysteinyl-tRNA synthetase